MSSSFDYKAWLVAQPGRAPETVRHVQEFWESRYKRRREGYEVELLVSTGFGVHRVATIFHEGPHMLMLAVVGGEFCDMLFAPVEQCSFLIRHFKPTLEKPRIVVGFAPPKDEASVEHGAVSEKQARK